jgi:hypothetical protein
MPAVPTIHRCTTLCAIFFTICLRAQNAPSTAPTSPSSIPPAPISSAATKQGSTAVPSMSPAESELNAVFQSKIKTEWDAFQSKDKKAYEALLDDDFQGVEVDARGERNKLQAVNEIGEQNAFTYSLWGFKVFPLGSDAALVIYESTLQFAPGAQLRLLRVYISEVWIKRSGQWKELHYQETHVK